MRFTFSETKKHSKARKKVFQTELLLVIINGFYMTYRLREKEFQKECKNVMPEYLYTSTIKQNNEGSRVILCILFYGIKKT